MAAFLMGMGLFAFGPSQKAEASTTASLPSANISDGVYVIVSQRSGKALDVWRGSSAMEANIIQWDRHDGANQQWKIVRTGDGYYNITSVKNPTLSFDVYRGSKASGTRVIQYQSLPWQANQKWKLIDNGDGTVTFIAQDAINSGTNYVLDVNGGSTANEANIIQYPYTAGNSNQRWYLVAPGASTTPVPNQTPQNPQTLAGKVIWLDNGHGLNYELSDGSIAYDESGAINGSYTERELTYNYAVALKTQLVALGATVYITEDRLGGTIFYNGGVNPNTGAALTGYQKSLDARGLDAASVGADIFLSIHFNSADAAANGTLTDYYYPNVPTVDTQIPVIAFNDVNGNGWDYVDYEATSRFSLAKDLAGMLQPLGSTTSYGVMNVSGGIAGAGQINVNQNNDWRFLRNASMPAVLMELGFLSNTSDFAKIYNGGTPNPSIIGSIRDSIVTYFNNHPTGWDF